MRCTKSLSLAATSILSIAAAVLFVPPSAAPAEHPKYGGTLRVELQISRITVDPREWKPGSVAAGQSEKVAALLFDRLLTLDDYGRFQPALAIEWTHDAAFRTWQFKLRPGVKFSDGSPLTSKEVAASLQSLLPSAWQISTTDSTVQIHAPDAMADLLEQLASGGYFIFRPQPGGVLLGTGPFTLAESSTITSTDSNLPTLRTSRIKLIANENAWEGRPFLDAIEFTLGQTALRQILDLQVGRTDLIDIPPDLVRKARQENLRIWSSPPSTLLALRFDDAQSFTSNQQLREALDLSLDRDTMANVLLQRQALPAPALLPQWLSGYAFLLGTSMNLERAKQIRSSLPGDIASAADPLRLRVDALGDLMKLLCERVAVNARQANIAIQVVSHTAVSGTAALPPTGLHLFAWHYDSLSPRTELFDFQQFLHTDAGATQKSVPNDAATEQLYDAERNSLDTRQVLPLLLLPDYLGIAPNVRNWSASPSGDWRLADVWLDSTEPATSNSNSPQSRSTEPGVRP